MSVELNILDIPNEEIIQNKTQKQIAYEILQQETNLDKETITCFYEMDVSLGLKQRPISNMPSILLKYVMKYCMFIVTNLDKNYSISLQAEIPIYAIKNNKFISIPSNEQFKVVGIRIPNLFLKAKPYNLLVHYDHVNDIDISQSGKYGLTDELTDNYTQTRKSFTHVGIPHLSSNIVMFENDEHVIKILNVIIDYIDFMERYYQITYPILRYDMIPPTIVGNSHLAWKIQNGKLIQESNLKSKTITKNKTEKSNIFIDYSSDLLQVLNEVQNSKFGDSFYYDILYMLDSNNMIKLYNIGSKLGIDNEIFKKEYNKLKDKINYDKNYLNQVNLGYTKQLEFIKRKNIAYKKFQIKDLSLLSKKQNEIVELELKKLEINDKSLNNNNNVLLWNNMRNSMLEQTSLNLKNAIRSVEKNISKKELNEFNLLPGGVCPHVYHAAVITLESFGKIDVNKRDYLINNFALPGDTSGYFCKICGEHIADSDNNSLLKFTGERNLFIEDDPIKQMIWKEAMFIISTNVRFTSLITIKPLVNSLANGLRNQISNEGSKLYRIKTNTGETIKDTLNLYASIYIYAALCALMMANPGKLIFAREPSKSNYKTSKVVEVDDKVVDKVDEIKYNIVDEVDEIKGGKLVKKNVNLKITKRKFGNLQYKIGGKVVTDNKAAEKIYLNTALKLILISKEPIISKLKNMTVDLIKQIFIKSAYTWAMKYAKPIHVSDNADLDSKDNNITLDPFYKYVYLAKSLSGVKTNYDNVNVLLGKSESTIVKEMKDNISAYSNVKPTKFIGDKDSKLDFKYESYVSMLEYYNNLIYTKSFVPKHLQVIEYQNKFSKLLEVENKLIYENKKLLLRPLIDIPIEQDLVAKYNKFDQYLLDLAQHYCKDGNQHKTVSYIYTDSKSNNVEIDKATIVNWLETNNLEKLKTLEDCKITDEKCGKCNILIRSAKSQLKADKTFNTMFKLIDDISAFYQYYETRCPLGNLHEIENNTCINCKFQTNYVNKLDKSYYDKYSNFYLKIQNEKLSLAIKSLKSIDNNVKLEPLQLNNDYQFTLRKVAEWSQILNIKYNLLVNIGLFEGLKYELIESSEINPSKTVEPNMTRAMRIKTHIFNVIREYNIVVNHENLVDYPLVLKEMINEQKKIESKNFANSLPKFEDFIILDNKYKHTINVVNYNNFLLEYLANIMVQLYNISNKYNTLGKLLSKYFTNQILISEKFICKPEPFFSKLMSIDNSSSESSGVDEWGSNNSSDASNNSDNLTDLDDDIKAETYENDIDNEGFDVENADDIWEND
jgi:hypothetical protein